MTIPTLRVNSLTLWLVLASSVPLSAQDWPRYGHDGALTGRSALPGEITQPRVCWSYSAAGRKLQIELNPAHGEHSLALSSESLAASESRQLAIAGPGRLDVDGSGILRPVTESHHERWARILPDTPGYQRVAWNHTWTDQAVCRLQLFAYNSGMRYPIKIWETDPPEGTIFQPLCIVFDIDADGVQEICVAAHYRVMIFEGTTGRKETELRYHSSRPYGWFGLSDVDADGQQELITIGDFQSHIDVLEFEPHRPEAERLSVKWRRDIEQDIEKRSKWPQVGPRPVVDVTGDGRPEIVVNIFNDQGDSQWHVTVLDAATGETKADLPRHYFLGAAQLADRHPAWLFVTSTNGIVVHRAGRIELVEWTEQGTHVRWHQESSEWCTADLPRLGPTWSTTASQGMRHVLLNGAQRPVFFVRSWDLNRQDRISLSAWRCDAEGSIAELWKISGLPESVACVPTDISTDVPPSALLLDVHLAGHERSELAGDNVQPHIVSSRSLGIDVSMPVVAETEQGGGKSVVVEGPGSKILAIAPPLHAGDSPRLRWQRPGRGMRDGSRTLGVLATDLDQDGTCEIIVADQAKEGHAQLVAYRGDGSNMWCTAFDQIPGEKPVWNIGALTFWWDGRFRGPHATDLFVNVRRGLMHSDVGQLIDGRSGERLWMRDKAEVPDEFQWGYAGAPLATVDVNSDQLDELVCLHPVCFWIADARSGVLTFGQELASRKAIPAWAAYGEPMVYDFDDDGQQEILLDSPYILALLEQDGTLIWHGLPRDDYPVNPGEGNVGETTQCRHALVDIDADGQFEIASAGYGDGVRVIDPRSGTVLWSLAAPQPTGPKVASANIDGQGGDEIIYPAGNTLVAVTGDAASGRILWTWNGPAALSMPAIADVEGDGRAEIIIQDAQATIHCLDAAGPRE